MSLFSSQVTIMEKEQVQNVPIEVIRSLRDVLPVRFECIPESLQALPQWLVWQYAVDNRGVIRKAPYSPASGKLADATDIRACSTFEEAKLAYKNGIYAGIGLALFSTVVAIDYDKCIHEGEILEPYKSLIKSFPTYYEISPSSKGIRGFAIGSLPGSRRRGATDGIKAELYTERRYVSVTGLRLNLPTLELSTDQSKLDSLYYRLFPETQEQTPTRGQHIERMQMPLSTDAIIEKALNAKNGSTFKAFMEGNWQSMGKYQSKSDSDFAFCLLISYWARDCLITSLRMWGVQAGKPLSTNGLFQAWEFVSLDSPRA